MLGFCLFLFGRAGNSQKNISPDNQGSSSETHLQQQNAQQAESRGSSQENRALATRMAKEADTLSNLGKRVQAIAMYQEALKIDPENELAKTNLSLLNERVVKLAESCFNNGLQAYNFFEYETAINQWENTLFLLEKNKKHKLYIKTSRFLEEAREKAIK
jgi:tetratricopeptide (TPR) repeat protein